jgi:hypothetical protein
MEGDSDRQDQNAQIILQTITISVSAAPNPSYYSIGKSTKIKNKPDPAILQTSYLFNEIKKGHQNLVRLSLKSGIRV